MIDLWALMLTAGLFLGAGSMLAITDPLLAWATEDE